MPPLMVSEMSKCKTPEQREARAKELESLKITKYAMKIYPAYPEVPGMTLDTLRERHRIIYEERYSKLASSFRSTVDSGGSVECRKNDAAKQANSTSSQMKPSLDSLFCIGIGSVSHDEWIPEWETYPTMTQVVLLEAIRDVLQEVYSFETSYVQDPTFNKLDYAFMADRGFTVTRTVEADMTSESCLFVTPMEIIVPSGMVADYQPKLLVTSKFDSPEKTDKDAGNYAKHQHFIETHIKHDNLFKDVANRKYQYWVRKD